MKHLILVDPACCFWRVRTLVLPVQYPGNSRDGALPLSRGPARPSRRILSNSIIRAFSVLVVGYLRLPAWIAARDQQQTDRKQWRKLWRDENQMRKARR